MDYVFSTGSSFSFLYNVYDQRYSVSHSQHFGDITENKLVKDMVKDAVSKGFTHLALLAEKNKECNGYDTRIKISSLLDHCFRCH